MSKTKTPFFSLGSHGTVGEALTTQKRGSATLVRYKPLPTDPYSLPQAYQRWLYQDYAYLWTKQSLSVRQAYASSGVRHHLTGFQYWMKTCLNTLPGILLYAKLDEKSGTIAYDSSSYGTNGIITGATPTSGIIDGALIFDGLNDKVDFGNPPQLLNLTEKSVFLFFNDPGFTGTIRLLYWGNNAWAPYGDAIDFLTNANLISVVVRNTAGVQKVIYVPFTPNTDNHIGYTWDGTTFKVWMNGVQSGVDIPFTGTIACTLLPIRLGTRINDRWYNALADHLLIFDHALDPVLIARWAERRYPS